MCCFLAFWCNQYYPRQSPTNLQLFLHFIDHHGSINISSSPWFLSRGSCFFAPLLGFSNEVKSVNDKRSSFLNWWMTKSMSVHGSSIPLPSSPVHYSRVCFEKKIWLSVFFCEDNGKIQYYKSEFLVMKNFSLKFEMWFFSQTFE